MPKEKLTPKTFFEELSEFQTDSFYDVNYTNKFKKSVELCYKRGYNLKFLSDAIKTLAKQGILPFSYIPHKLEGYPKNQNIFECHIKPDWLLIWEQNDTELILLLIETGTHSDLF
ncbi:MAG: type II toxin-antitoxin system YafQ family toxin [Prevotellaceae bacterium]|jgi:mRNA interferase YafQ|nr:type II toxin-antitoxin system YafQ family toxin [Prevotellaceae bacterium]